MQRNFSPRFCIGLALCLIASLSASLAIPGAALANRSIAKGKSDQSKGVPTSYKVARQSRHYKQFSKYLTMSDGTKIAVDVYLPDLRDGQTKVPVIFEQSRYWRVIKPRYPLNLIYGKPLSLYRSEFLSHGYAWVVTDARGAGASFGERPWELPPIDVSDSKEIMDWILAQSWCNGKIGLLGHSYSGNMAEFTLLNKNPAVKAAAVLSSAFDAYTDVLRPGGLPLQPFFDQWMQLNRAFDNNDIPPNLGWLKPILRKMKAVDEDKGGVMLKQAVAQHKENSRVDTDEINFRDDTAIGEKGHYTELHERCLIMLKDRFGDDFLKMGVDLSSASGYIKDLAAANVPVYAAAGWLDGGNSNAAIKRYLNYTAPGRKLILGPWDHDFINISPFSRGGFSRFRIDREMLKFFDFYIKGTGTLAQDKPVHYYTLGEEQWHGSDTWPPQNKSRSFYLGKQNSLGEKRELTAGSAHYQVDEKVGSGKEGRWDCLLGNILLDPYSTRKIEDRRLLLFETAKLESNTTASGNPIVRLYIKPDGADCSLFCYLEDVWPNGSVHYVTEGELLCGNRTKPGETPTYKTVGPFRSFRAADYSPLDRNIATEIEVELLPMSYQFKKGHRIRLAIAGRDRDHFRAPAYADLCKDFEVQYGPDCPSKIELPVENR